MSGPAKSDVQIVADAAAANREIGGLKRAIDDSTSSAGRVDDSIDKLGASSSSLSKHIDALGLSGKGAAKSMKTMHGTADGLDKLMGPLGSKVGSTTQAFSSLAGALSGGVFGIAVGAAVLGVGLLTKALKESKEAADLLAQDAADSVDSLTQRITARTDAVRKAALAGMGIDALKMEMEELTADYEETLFSVTRLAAMTNEEMVNTYGERLHKAREMHSEEQAAVNERMFHLQREMETARHEMARYDEAVAASGALSDAVGRERARQAVEEKARLRALTRVRKEEAVETVDFEGELYEWFAQKRAADEKARSDARIAARQAEHARLAALDAKAAQDEWREFDRLEKEKTRALEQQLEERRRAEQDAAYQVAMIHQRNADIIVGLGEQVAHMSLDALEDVVAGNEVAWHKIGTMTLRSAGTQIMGIGAAAVAGGVQKLLYSQGAVGWQDVAGGMAIASVGMGMGGASAIVDGSMSRLASMAGGDFSAAEATETMVAEDFRTTRTAAPESQGVTVQHHYHAAVIGDTTTTSRTIAEGSERARRDLLTP